MSRKTFSAEFKVKVALEGIRGERTINEIASGHGVHPNQVSDWKREAIAGLKETFSVKRGRKKAEEAATVIIPCRFTAPHVASRRMDISESVPDDTCMISPCWISLLQKKNNNDIVAV